MGTRSTDDSTPRTWKPFMSLAICVKVGSVLANSAACLLDDRQYFVRVLLRHFEADVEAVVERQLDDLVAMHIAVEGLRTHLDDCEAFILQLGKLIGARIEHRPVGRERSFGEPRRRRAFRAGVDGQSIDRAGFKL